VICAALAAFAAVAAYGQLEPDRVIAIVNGDEIRGAEYYHRMEFLAGVGHMRGQRFDEFPPGFLTIEQLVGERLALQLAKQQGVLPTDEEIDAEYKARMVDNPQMEAQWKATGQSLDDLRYQIKMDLTQFKIQTNGVTVTDSEVTDFFTKNPDTFMTPKGYKLRVLAVANDAGKSAVDQALAAGPVTSDSFGEVAKKYSVEASKELGGEIGSVAESSLAQPIQTALSTTKIGTSTGWISSGQATYRFFVEDIQPAKKLDLTPSLRRRIRRKLMMDRGAIKNNIVDLMKKMRAEAKVEIKNDVFQDAYNKLIKTYLQGG
jgi:foldase protein PrsA